MKHVFYLCSSLTFKICKKRSGSLQYLKITIPSTLRIGRKLYTTEHALGYVLEQEYQNNPEVWSNEKCLAWAAEDDALPNYTDSLLNCPCTLDQALTDSGQFQPDTGCSMFAGSVCTYHVGAKHCVRSVFAR